MFHSLRIYYAYFCQFLLARMSYKLDFAASLFANVLNALSGLVFVYFLMNSSAVTNLQGWRKEEVLFIYGYSMISVSLFSMVSLNLYQFGDRYIIQGQFDRVLLRPVNSLFQVIFESFNLDSFGTILTGFGVVIACARKLGLHFSWWDWCWMFVSCLSGGIILLSTFVIVASVSFHFEDRIGISAPIYNLINFGRYPIPIFGRFVRFILCWVVPVAFVAFFPATHFLGHGEFRFFCYLTPVVAVFQIALAGIAWRLGVSQYSSTGN